MDAANISQLVFRRAAFPVCCHLQRRLRLSHPRVQLSLAKEEEMNLLQGFRLSFAD